MKKVDDKRHDRLNNALIKLKRDLTRSHHPELATEIDVNRRVLVSAYQNYIRSMERLFLHVNQYHEVFEEAYVNYRAALKKSSRAQQIAHKKRTKMGKAK